MEVQGKGSALPDEDVEEARDDEGEDGRGEADPVIEDYDRDRGQDGDEGADVRDVVAEEGDDPEEHLMRKHEEVEVRGGRWRTTMVEKKVEVKNETKHQEAQEQRVQDR